MKMSDAIIGFAISNRDRAMCSSRWILSIFLGLSTVAANARGELVEMRDGQSFAGRILTENGATVRLKTGTNQGVRELEISAAEIVSILRSVEEMDAIARCAEAMTVLRWAAGYFQAGLPSQADQCIARAAALDRSVTDKPLAEGADAYRRFWNERVFRIRSNETSSDDGRGLLTLARWSAAAGLEEHARETIRFAWQADSGNEEIEQQAAAWGVLLQAWIRPDLTAAIETSLFTRHIHDQGTDVTAMAGHAFLLVPIRYREHCGRRVLTRLVLPKSQRSCFYGVYPRYRRSTPKSLSAAFDGPAYERMELRPSEDGADEVVWKNSAMPRVAAEDKARQESTRGRPQSERPSGWAVVVLEVESSAPSVRFEWDDGFVDEIDLSYLRAMDRWRLGSSFPAVDSDIVRQSIGLIRGKSGVMRELALLELGVLRRRASAESLSAWAQLIEPMVVEAGGSRSDEDQFAAWRYFSMQTSLSDAARETIGSASNQLKCGWIALIGRHGVKSTAANPAIAREILYAMLSTGNGSVCEGAIDALVRLGGEVDWLRIVQASQTAQMASIEKISTLENGDAQLALRALMRGAKPSTAEKIAEAAAGLAVSIEDPEDPILAGWEKLRRDSDRVAFVTVLTPVRLGDLLYSERIGLIVRITNRKKCSPSLRDAILRMVVNQAGMRLAARTPVDRNTFGFPALSRIGSRDPIHQAMLRAAASDDEALRSDALSVLIRQGFAQNAARIFLETNETERAAIGAFEAMLARPELAGTSDGFLAFCGALVDAKRLIVSERVLRHLSQCLDSSTAPERWRLAAAVKMGLHLERLMAVSASLSPAPSAMAFRLLSELGHIAPEELQQVSSAQNEPQRKRQFRDLDQRWAERVGGRYGVIAVLETTTAVAYQQWSGLTSRSTTRVRWAIPVLRTIELPSLTLALNAENGVYRVLWNATELGRGAARDRVRPIRGPEAYLPALVGPTLNLIDASGWGWPGPVGTIGAEPVRATGPDVLPGNRPAMETLRPDFMTLDLTAYLARAVVDSGVFSKEQTAAWAGQPLRITLRYAAFGSFVGASPIRALPDQKAPGDRHVFNLMIVLERLD